MLVGCEDVITGAVSLYHNARNAYHGLNPTLRGAMAPLKNLLLFLPPIFLLERLSGGKTTQYRSAGFRQDLVYVFLYSSGLFKALITIYVLGALTPFLQVFDLKLLDIFQRHYVVRAVVYYVLVDFMSYWLHRLRHASRLLWAFHTTHHSQKDLSVITTNRFHPVEELLSDIIAYVPLLMLGGTQVDFVPLVWLFRITLFLQHSNVQWRFGPLRKVLVTPHFHAFHHSTDPAYHNCNFGATLSVWDYLFGTAVDEQQKPTRYGLLDVEMPTVASTFWVPFRLVYETYFKRRRPIESAGD